MVESFAKNWWTFVLRGVVAIIFGILAFVWPGITLASLVLLIGAYLLVDGIFAIVAAFSREGTTGFPWLALLEGIIGVVAGILTFFWPNITAVVLLYMIAAWAILTGILEIVSAVRLRQVIENEWWLILGGLASIVFGVLAFIWPGATALAVLWLIAAYAIIFGVLLIVLGFRLRGWRDERTHSGLQPS